MSLPLSEDEKTKMKLIRNKFSKDKDSLLTIEFIDRVKNNELMYGDNVLKFEDVLCFCKEKELDGINSFKGILCYAVKGKPKVSQYILGSWFGETSALGDKVRYMVTKFYDDLIRERTKND